MYLFKKLFTKGLCLILSLSIVFLSLISSAQAVMVTTSELITEQSTRQQLSDTSIIFQRKIIQTELIAMGVDRELVLARVASMTDIEIQELSNSIKNKEAGGNPIVIGVVVIALGFMLWAYLFSRGWGSVH